MAYQKVFKRYEIKYMITIEQMQRILATMAPYMTQDRFGHATIRNIYFDTDDYVLARHSIVKPDFKEKIRIRSYSKAREKSEVFVELKRKFDKVVYKRRVGLTEKQAMDWTCRRLTPGMTGASTAASENEDTGSLKAHTAISAVNGQLGSEIEYFLDYYGELRPAVFLSYDREAFKMKDGTDFRVTFDSNILARDYDLSLESDVYGTNVLDRGKVLMELKCSGGIPMWMTDVLSREHIYKTSFSKYGKAYTQMILPALQQDRSTASAAAAAKADKETAAQPLSAAVSQGGYGRRRRRSRSGRHELQNSGRFAAFTFLRRSMASHSLHNIG